MSTILERAANLFNPATRNHPSVVESAPSPSGDTGIPSLDEIKKDVRKTRRGSKQIDEENAERLVQAEIDSLWSADNCEDLCCAYFDYRLAATGYEGFDLDPTTRRKLAVTGSMSLRLLRIDPRWAGLVLYLSTMTKLIITTEAGYRRSLANLPTAGG